MGGLIVGVFALDSIGESLGLAIDERTVKQGEGLEGCGGDGAMRGANGSVRAIEGGEKWGSPGTGPHAVDGSALESLG